MSDSTALIAKVNKALGKEAVTMLSSSHEKVTGGLSTGSLKLNNALSGSPFVGFAWGRIVEVFGPEQSGKTTLALHCISEAQKLESETGKPVPCMFIDAEHAFDPDYATSVGVDLSRLAFDQPDNGEEALQAVEEGVKSGYKLIVVDSVAALTPKAEIEGTMGQAHIGLQARLMSQACRKLTGILSKQKAIVIFINQIRIKVGVMFGNPETTSGGNALKFYASYRLDVRSPRGGSKTSKQMMGYADVEDTVETGIKTKFKIVKNKLYPPHRLAIVDVVYGKGFDKPKDIVGFLEYANAFVVPVSGKTKTPVVKIPSKKKLYTARGLENVLDDPEVQADVIALIKRLEVVE